MFGFIKNLLMDGILLVSQKNPENMILENEYAVYWGNNKNV